MEEMDMLPFLYALQELLESGNVEGAKNVVEKAIEQAEE